MSRTRVWIWAWVVGTVLLAGAVLMAQPAARGAQQSAAPTKPEQAAEPPKPAPQLTEAQRLRAQLVVAQVERADAQRQALQAQLVVVTQELERLQGEAAVMQQELIAALGGKPGDRFDWQTMTLVKAPPATAPPTAEKPENP